MKLEEINTIITEGRDAYLYHVTDYNSLTEILSSGEIRPGPFVDGVSLTRNPRLTNIAGTYPSQKNVRLVFDQRRLSQTHRIRPFNDGGQAIRGLKQDHTREDEELVAGKIDNLKRYLVAVISIEPFDEIVRRKGSFDAWRMFEVIETHLDRYGVDMMEERSGKTLDQWMDENFDDLAAEVA